MEKADIASMTLPRLTEWVTGELDEPKFRAGQLYRWLHQKRAGSFAEMTNLSAALRARLEQTAFLTAVTTRRRLESRLDGTVKLLLELPDRHCVEAVLMRYEHGLSLCISTQVGCRMGCKFCASTLGGLVRNLTPAEMLGEVYEAERQAGEPIASLVLMGIGEPLDNYRNVLDFLTILSSPEGRGLSLRHVSLSTCGLCDRIDELAELGLGLTLSISLHAADDETRSGIMPVNRKYNIARLMKSCKNYFAKTGRRISYEYALIAGVNDTPAHAEALASLLAGQNCHINLIPVNPVAERGTRRPDRSAVRRFADRLNALGQNATVRRELGSDIAAACGQLRRAEAESDCPAPNSQKNAPRRNLTQCCRSTEPPTGEWCGRPTRTALPGRYLTAAAAMPWSATVWAAPPAAVSQPVSPPRRSGGWWKAACGPIWRSAASTCCWNPLWPTPTGPFTLAANRPAGRCAAWAPRCARPSSATGRRWWPTSATAAATCCGRTA